MRPPRPPVALAGSRAEWPKGAELSAHSPLAPPSQAGGLLHPKEQEGERLEARKQPLPPPTCCWAGGLASWSPSSEVSHVQCWRMRTTMAGAPLQFLGSQASLCHPHPHPACHHLQWHHLLRPKARADESRHREGLNYYIRV